ncbi:extracellular solute-binding protein [Lonepinella sp. BR2474]|uniref:extracellular solute-binding protein n=1 Tax=Lonepinella sp. BR2474 TaxID=3434548 RepID=UPI003F6E2D00
MKKLLKKNAILTGFAAAGLMLSNVAMADLLVYNGQPKNTGVEKAAQLFSEKTGIKVELKAGKGSDFVNQLKEEGDKSSADIFIAEGANLFLTLSDAGLLAPVSETALNNVKSDNVPPAPNKDFVTIGVRGRVLAYNPTKIAEKDLPTSWTEMVNDPKWKGNFSYHPASGALVEQVAVYQKLHGVEATKAFLKSLKANGQSINGHLDALKKVDAGELGVAIINQYYLERLYKEKGQENVQAKIHYMRNADADSTLVFSGAAVLKATKQAKEAQQFLDFLTSKEGQEVYVSTSAEWPTNAKAVSPVGYLVPLDSLNPPKVTLNSKAELDEAKALIKEAGIKKEDSAK